MKKLVGFTGPAGCGKTTAAKLLQDVWEEDGLHGQVFAFAAPMKECLKDLFDFEHYQLYTLEGKEEIDIRYGVTPRYIMQRFGTEFIRKVVPNLWVLLMKQELDYFWRDDSPVVIEDIRFRDESQLVRELGGTIVHIRGRGGIDSGHKSEVGLAVQENDIVIDNSGTLVTLKSELNKLL